MIPAAYLKHAVLTGIVTCAVLLTLAVREHVLSPAASVADGVMTVAVLTLAPITVTGLLRRPAVWRPNQHSEPPLPTELSFDDILDGIGACGDSVLILGRGRYGRTAALDLDSESPHVAISSGTGGGKSALLRLLIVQLLMKGTGEIHVLDVKRVSQNWARDVPGVFIHRSMPEILGAVSLFREEMERRYSELDVNPSAVFPRRVLICEEQNSLTAYAREYWTDYRASLPTPKERNSTPKTCPLISDLGYLLFQGRAARMNVISVFQRMTAVASGGGDLRDQYGARVLMRFSAAAWRVLAGTSPIPRPSRIPGRARFVLGDECMEVQLALISETGARECALKCARVPAGHREQVNGTPQASDPAVIAERTLEL